MKTRFGLATKSGKDKFRSKTRPYRKPDKGHRQVRTTNKSAQKTNSDQRNSGTKTRFGTAAISYQRQIRTEDQIQTKHKSGAKTRFRLATISEQRQNRTENQIKTTDKYGPKTKVHKKQIRTKRNSGPKTSFGTKTNSNLKPKSHRRQIWTENHTWSCDKFGSKTGWDQKNSDYRQIATKEKIGLKTNSVRKQDSDQTQIRSENRIWTNDIIGKRQIQIKDKVVPKTR